MIEYETTIICPDNDAGHQALQERMSEGWEFFCNWVEEEWSDGGDRFIPINHIALRLAAKE